MEKFTVSYKLKTTAPDLHTQFKEKAEAERFCEYIFATDANGKGQYCKLPNTNLWCERQNLNDVSKALLRIAKETLDEAVKSGKINHMRKIMIETEGGLLENFSVSYIVCSSASTVSLVVKDGAFIGSVDYFSSIKDALIYQNTKKRGT